MTATIEEQIDCAISLTMRSVNMSVSSSDVMREYYRHEAVTLEAILATLRRVQAQEQPRRDVAGTDVFNNTF